MHKKITISFMLINLLVNVTVFPKTYPYLATMTEDDITEFRQTMTALIWCDHA